jgi:hypothetical protein
MVKRPFTESHSSSLRLIHLTDVNRLEEAFSSFCEGRQLAISWILDRVGKY